MTDRLNNLIVNLFARLQREEGQSTAEYAIVLCAVAGVAIAIAAIFTGTLTSAVSSVSAQISKAI